jgi:hypothetical protein
MQEGEDFVPSFKEFALLPSSAALALRVCLESVFQRAILRNSSMLAAA